MNIQPDKQTSVNIELNNLKSSSTVAPKPINAVTLAMQAFTASVKKQPSFFDNFFGKQATSKSQQVGATQHNNNVKKVL